MSTPDPHDFANEADVEEQQQPLLDEPPDEETAAGSDAPPRREEVDEADYQEQIEPAGGPDDEDYPYDG